MKTMSSFSCGVVAVCFLYLLLLPVSAMSQPTAGGSIVLAKCNSWVQFTVNRSSAEVVIKNICLKKSDQARVDITIGSTKTSQQIPYGSSISKGGFTGTTTFKVVNIEKGTSGSTCNSRGPADSDVRVFIPGNATNITYGGMVTGTTCTVCGANFSPLME